MDTELIGLLIGSVLILVGLIVFISVWAGTNIICPECQCSTGGTVTENIESVPNTDIPIDNNIVKTNTVRVPLTGSSTRAVVTYSTGFTDTGYELAVSPAQLTPFMNQEVNLTDTVRFSTGFTTNVSYPNFPFTQPLGSVVDNVNAFRLPRVVEFDGDLFIFAVGNNNVTHSDQKVYLAKSLDGLTGESWSPFVEAADFRAVVTGISVTVFSNMLVVAIVGQSRASVNPNVPLVLITNTGVLPFSISTLPVTNWAHENLSCITVASTGEYLVLACIQNLGVENVLQVVHTTDLLTWTQPWPQPTSPGSVPFWTALNTNPSIVRNVSAGYLVFFVDNRTDLAVYIYDAVNNDVTLREIPHATNGLHWLSATVVNDTWWVCTMGGSEINVSRVTDPTFRQSLQKEYQQNFANDERLRGFRLFSIGSQLTLVGAQGRVTNTPLADGPSSIMWYQFDQNLNSYITATRAEAQDALWVDGPDFDQYVLDTWVTSERIHVVTYTDESGSGGKLRYFSAPAGILLEYRAAKQN